MYNDTNATIKYSSFTQRDVNEKYFCICGCMNYFFVLGGSGDYNINSYGYDSVSVDAIKDGHNIQLWFNKDGNSYISYILDVYEFT